GSDLLEGGLGQTLNAMDLGIVRNGVGELFLGGRLDGLLTFPSDVDLEAREQAGPLRRAQRVAGHPYELIRSRRICDPGLLVVAQAECNAAGAVGAKVGLPCLPAIVEADIVPSNGPPGACAVELVAEGARLVRPREGILLSEAEIANAATLGHQHDRS